MSSHDELELGLPNLPGVVAGWEMCMPDAERTARFTGDLIAKQDERREAILRAMAEGLSDRSIVRAFGVHHRTVAVIRARWAGDLDAHKQRLGETALDVARMAIERIADEIDDMPRASLPIVAGVMIDKAQLLTGGATSRVEQKGRQDRGPVVVDIDAWLSAAPVDRLHASPATVDS